MGEEVRSHMIKLSSLREHQRLFQKDISELINLYLMDGKRKITALKKAFAEKNWENFLGAIQELRYRSIDIGAHQFSFYCLSLEICALELREFLIPNMIHFIEQSFLEVQKELERLQQTPLCRKGAPVY